MWISFWGSGFLSSFLQVMPNLLLESGEDDVPTGVETGGQTPGIASCGLQSDNSKVFHSRSRSWELMEQAFDDGNNDVRMRTLLVLFLIGSRFHQIFAFQINSSPNPAATVLHASGHQIVCFCVAPSVRWKRLSCWIL